MIKCPKCKAVEIEEVMDDAVIKLAWKLNSKTKKYEQFADNSEGYGDSFIRCLQCNHRFTDKQHERFLDLVS